MPDNIETLIEHLKRATQPDRGLDLAIAKTVNWAEIAPNVVDISAGRPQLPQFTNYLDDALKLARAIDPGHVGAVAWDAGQFVANIENQEPSTGANPAICLCIAALTAKLRLDGEL
ncbi:hypothetical protein [Sinorhizobium meliloti]|uniref:hypothetical protein n=1 Tax=Rhizobium meliloti TaxID=382 RepID=UPI0018E8F44F|nr:hypothetical protein [Sinorhizobium meliloti]QQF01592.1 hypothetical protein JFX10_05160 [Sinorhizobium meliloti]